MSEMPTNVTNELRIPADIVPPEKKWTWVRYAVKTAMSADHDFIDKDSIVLNAKNGYRPLWAVECPRLHTEERRKNSLLFIQHHSQQEAFILCEKDDPNPWWEKAMEWLKTKIDEAASWLKEKVEDIAVKAYDLAKEMAVKIYDWIKGWFGDK